MEPSTPFAAGLVTAAPTPASLLERLRRPGDQRAWGRFVELYSPLLYYWGRRLGLQPQDAGDLAQDVLTTLVQKLPAFHYEAGKRFRGWLWTLTLNKLREKKRRGTLPMDTAGAEGLTAATAADPADEVADAEYRQYLVDRALQLMRAEFQPRTWQAFWEHVALGRPAGEVAAELGLTTGAIYAGKYRVLAPLREELAGLLD
jgi:RNA polymerase sigma-70 factor (ECF subfamily)